MGHCILDALIKHRLFAGRKVVLIMYVCKLLIFLQLLIENVSLVCTTCVFFVCGFCHLNDVNSSEMQRRKEGNVLFNDTLNTFYLWLYGVGHMVMDHSNSKRGNPLPPHGLLFPISSKGSFIYIIPQTG